jgi:tetratricopeptide (TPR) repeat protein
MQLTPFITLFILYRKFILMVLSIGLLAGCNSTAPFLAKDNTLPNALFPSHVKQKIETHQEIFALDDDMRAFVDKHTAGKGSDKDKLSALVAAIFDRKVLSLSYQEAANTNARNTFKQGTANCLSLTIMTYAMTQHLGMRSAFQDIAIPEFWTRRGGNTLINRHINLVVKPRKVGRILVSNESLTVDFDPLQGMNQFYITQLTKAELVSNFYANKAADKLIAGKPDSAYAYLKAAINDNAMNDGAWLNLGVLLSQEHHYEQAEMAYRQAISINGSFASAYENLALLYKRQGKLEASGVLLSRLHKKRRSNPYYHIMLGDVAAETKDFTLAITHYKKAISINRKPHEFHFRLAKVYYAQGDKQKARDALESAKKWANDSHLDKQYSQKIANLLASR